MSYISMHDYDKLLTDITASLIASFSNLSAFNKTQHLRGAPAGISSVTVAIIDH